MHLVRNTLIVTCVQQTYPTASDLIVLKLAYAFKDDHLVTIHFDCIMVLAPAHRR